MICHNKTVFYTTWRCINNYAASVALTRGEGKCQNEWDAEGLCALAWILYFPSSFLPLNKAFFYSSVIVPFTTHTRHFGACEMLCPAIGELHCQNKKPAKMFSIEQCRRQGFVLLMPGSLPLCSAPIVHQRRKQIHNNSQTSQIRLIWRKTKSLSESTSVLLVKRDRPGSATCL